MVRIFVMVILIILNNENFSQIFWQQLNGPRIVPAASGMIMTDSGYLFAVTSEGIIRSMDRGINWEVKNNGLGPNPIIWSITNTPNNTLIVGTYEEFHRSTDNGESWNVVHNYLVANGIREFKFTSQGFVLAATGCGVHVSNNDGLSWHVSISGMANCTVGSIELDSDNNIYAATGGGVYKSTDLGSTWILKSNGLGSVVVTDIAQNSIGDFFVSSYGNIYNSTNRGDTWFKVSTNIPNVYIDGLFIDSADNIFANINAGRGIWKSTNGGSTWLKIYDSPYYFRKFFQIDQNLILASTLQHGIIKTTDRGISWNNFYYFGFGLAAATSVIVTGNGNLVCGTGDYGIQVSTNLGMTWNKTQIYDPDIYSSIFYDNNNLYASSKGIFFRSSTNGDTWDTLTGISNISTFYLSKDGSIYTGGAYKIYWSTDHGINWVQLGNGTSLGGTEPQRRTFRAIAVSPDSSIYIATYDSYYEHGVTFIYKYLIRSTNKGLTWINLSTSFDIYSILIRNNGDIYLGLSNGIVKSTDKGYTWEYFNNGIASYPVYIVSELKNGVLIAGTNNGIFRSDDNGNSWIAVTTIGMQSSRILDLFYYQDSRLYAATNLGVSYLDSKLPVELTSFSATANSKEVILSWVTATELNNQGFEVQRKFGSNGFVTIGSVKGHGTTTSPNNYTYVDKLTDAGKYFYRLKQIDFGGKYEYSQTVEVNWSPFSTYKLEQNYSNPFNPVTTIGFGIPEKGNVRLSVLNILGEEIKVLLNEEKEAGYHSIEFDGSDLPSGVYFYRIQSGNFIDTKKMILSK